MPAKIFLIFFLFFFISCKENYTPKPYGYFRIDFPEKNYHELQGDYPYHFEIASDAVVEADRENETEPYWININYPAYNAKIHLSYKPISTDTSLFYYQQDCHRMAYTHTIKAESINERFFNQADNKTAGLMYYIEGNTATSTQFYVTDSTHHFLRGALYFSQHPNKDSLAPVINYLRQDIITLMETVRFSSGKSEAEKSRR